MGRFKPATAAIRSTHNGPGHSRVLQPRARGWHSDLVRPALGSATGRLLQQMQCCVDPTVDQGPALGGLGEPVVD